MCIRRIVIPKTEEMKRIMDAVSEELDTHSTLTIPLSLKEIATKEEKDTEVVLSKIIKRMIQVESSVMIDQCIYLLILTYSFMLVNTSWTKNKHTIGSNY